MVDPYEAARVITSGTWLYDGAALFSVSIIAFPFDYWLEVGPADYEDDPVDPTPIGPDGYLYYISFGARRVDGSGYATIEEAKADAQRRVPTVIAWAS